MVKDSKVNLVSKINSSQGIKLVIKVYGGSSLNWEFNLPQASDDGNDKKKNCEHALRVIFTHFLLSMLYISYFTLFVRCCLYVQLELSSCSFPFTAFAWIWIHAFVSFQVLIWTIVFIQIMDILKLIRKELNGEAALANLQ